MSHFKQEYIDHLRSLANGSKQPLNIRMGLCSELSNRFGVYSFIMYHCKPAIRTFKHYSGSLEYPISHHTKEPIKGYEECENKWSTSTAYGKRRRLLCLHLANYMEKELNEHT